MYLNVMLLDTKTSKKLFECVKLKPIQRSLYCNEKKREIVYLVIYIQKNESFLVQYINRQINNAKLFQSKI